MEMTEFIKQERGPYSFECWHWLHRIPTGAGEFVVELQTEEGESAAPDRYMIERAEALARFARERGDDILDIVYAHYRAASEYWLRICDIPRDLRRDQVMSHVSDLFLVVARQADCDPPYQSEIHIIPGWDDEHAIHLTFEDERLTRLNGEAFEVADGVLRILYA